VTVVRHAHGAKVRRQVLLTVGGLAEVGQLLHRRVGQGHVCLACRRVVAMLVSGRKFTAL